MKQDQYWVQVQRVYINVILFEVSLQQWKERFVKHKLDGEVTDFAQESATKIISASETARSNALACII